MWLLNTTRQTQRCVLHNHWVHADSSGRNLGTYPIPHAGLKFPAALRLRSFLLRVFAENGLKFPSCCATEIMCWKCGWADRQKLERCTALPQMHEPPFWMQIRWIGSASLLMRSRERDEDADTWNTRELPMSSRPGRDWLSELSESGQKKQYKPQPP